MKAGLKIDFLPSRSPCIRTIEVAVCQYIRLVNLLGYPKYQEIQRLSQNLVP